MCANLTLLWLEISIIGYICEVYKECKESNYQEKRKRERERSCQSYILQILQYNPAIMILRRLSVLIGVLLLQYCRSEQNCTVWRGEDYRDCICGIEVLDSERVCQDEFTYLQTTQHQESFYCGFDCSNGGTVEYLDYDYSFYCHCPPGFHGFCCELGQNYANHQLVT